MALSAYQEIKESLRQLYLDDPRPWLVSFSGGKDSTMLASLIFDAILSVPETTPADAPPLVLLRDPFGYGASTPVVSHPERRPRRPNPGPVAVVPAPAPEPEQPTLTAIIWDEDPRATVRWNGRDFSVRQNSLFDDFVVKHIGPDQVVLERGGQELVLRLVKKGE